jgi:pilus assembly protein CpaB
VANDDNGRPLNVQVVTLLVTPEESEKLALASVDGRIQLALRNPLDLEPVNPNAIRREHLFQGGSVSPTPPPTPSTPRPAVARAPRKVEPPAPPPPPAPVVEAPKPTPPPTKREVQVIQGNQIKVEHFEARPEGK